MNMQKKQTRITALLTAFGLLLFSLTAAVAFLHLFQNADSLLFSLPPAALSLIALFFLLHFLAEERIHEAGWKTFLSNVPGFLRHCRYDSGLTLLDYSEGLLLMTGYTAAEINHELENRFIGLIAEEDQPGLWQNILDQLSSRETIELQYRLRRKDGSFLWVQEEGRLVPGHGGTPEFYSILMDVTESQKTGAELLQNLKRYETAVQKCGCTIFEYCPDSGCVCCLTDPAAVFGCDPSVNFPQTMVECGHVHSDDIKKFLSLFQKIGAGAQAAQGDFRLKNGSETFSWYRIRVAAVYDAAGNVQKAVGQISDITFQKQEVQKLLHRAQRDELTGLLNRATAKQLMEDALEENENCALMMVDIDHFKDINDTMGHVFGDTVLSEVGTELKKLFRATDLVGRLGGDEFAVMLKSVSKPSMIAEKAQAVQTSLSEIFSGINEARQITCSIGIARFPEDGNCFSDLYAKADTALYRAKRSGRKRFVFYDKLMEAEFSPNI